MTERQEPFEPRPETPETFVICTPLTETQETALVDWLSRLEATHAAQFSDLLRAVGVRVESSAPVSYRGPFNEPLIRQSDHLAALAAKEAEVERLRERQPHYDNMVDENGELKRAIARLQSEEDYGLTQTIKERDECEIVINDLYQAVMEEPPEWSNNFGYRDAVEDVIDYVHALRTKAVGAAS